MDPSISDRARLGSPLRHQPPNFASRFDNSQSYEVSMSGTPEMADQMDDLNVSDSSFSDHYDSDFPDTSSSIEEIPYTEAIKGVTVHELPTGLCYDTRMRYHSEVSATTGDNVHPEDPRRIYFIHKELREAGLIDTGNPHDLVVNQPLRLIAAREVTQAEVELVHVKKTHWDFVESTSTMNDEALIDLSEDPSMDSIYFNQLSFFSGKLSAGGAIETCKAVFEQKTVKNAIAVIRPPGHHAEVDKTMGFCLFNNACIASRVCQQDYGVECRKILILDWDVHHGNGCQKAFYDDPNILYISIHVHMGGSFYPATQDGAMDRCGAGPGTGKNVNIPWPSKGMGDGDYMYAFQQVVMPIATDFDPDLVIVAAGFDAAAGDELGGCFVTPACYAHMTHMLMSLARGKVAVCLEGGYNFQAISKSALAVTRTLMGEPPDRLHATQPTKSAQETVERVRHIQSKYWRCLNPKDPPYDIMKGVQLHDILRFAQAKDLYDQFSMTKLHVFQDKVSKSFDNQVVATPRWDEQRNLLVIFHDPPDLISPGGRVSNLTSPHDTRMKDGVTDYIQWAVSHNFGVIDVNVPEHITPADKDLTNSQDPIRYSSVENDEARIEGEKLINYIWTNYIELIDDDTNIILMGVGNAFHAIGKLIVDNDAVHSSITGVVGFIATNPVRPVSNSNNPWVTSWYRNNSLIFVVENHTLWKKTKDGGKLSKRYGDVRPSQGDGANEVMFVNQEVAYRWMLEKVKDDDATEDEELNDVQVQAHGHPTELVSAVPAAGGIGFAVQGGVIGRAET